MPSDNAHPADRQPGPAASDNRTPAGLRRRGRAPAALPLLLEAVHARYAGLIAAAAMLDPDTRRAYASRVRGYLAWLEHAGADGDPLTHPGARDGAVRDYRTWLQTTARRKPATINTILAALADFYTRAGLGPPSAQRLDLPQRAPRALDARDTTRWLRAVERWLSPRDRVIALLPFYAGLRLGETVALDLADVQLSARKGLITVRAGKGGRYREIPVHAGLREHLALWTGDERPGWPRRRHQPGAAAQPPRRPPVRPRRPRRPAGHRRRSPPRPWLQRPRAAPHLRHPARPRRPRPGPGRRAHGTRPDRDHPRLQPAHRRRRPGRHQQPPRRPLTSGSACLLPISGVFRSDPHMGHPG
jgi:hypothetical protein